MTDHPITPPPELLQQIADGSGTWLEKMSKAYRAGADQELEACLSWIRERPCTWTAEQLRAARRPRPKSHAEKALETLQKLSEDQHPCIYQDDSDWYTIRRALKRMQELEDG